MTKDLSEIFKNDKKYVLYHNIPKNNITAVFIKTDIYEFQGEISNWLWSRLAVKKNKNDKSGIHYKHRVYYKHVFNEVNEPKILTIIMYNPSYANQYSNDGTINNCIEIAVDNGYDGIEVLNMLTLRDSNIVRATKNSINEIRNFSYPQNVMDYFKGRDVLAAWGGYGKLPEKLRNYKDELHEKFLDILKNSNKYTYSKDLVDGKFPRHPSPKALNNVKSVKNKNKIKLYKFN